MRKERKYKALSKKTIAIILGAILLTSTVSYTYIKVTNKGNEASSELVSREREYKVKRGDLTAGIIGSGILKFNRVNQHFKNPVKINEVLVKEGQKITKGDKIASGVDEFTGSKVTLYAEADGVILELNCITGVTTNLENPVISIGEENKVLAEIPVSQNDINKIEEGQDVNLLASAFQDEKIKGKVKFINLKPNAEGGNTNYTVTVEIEKSELKLLDGMTASAQFIIKEVKDVLMLSNKAITLNNGKETVNVKQGDGTVKSVEIKTGFSDGKNSEIIEGLVEDDTVVVGGK